MSNPEEQSNNSTSNPTKESNKDCTCQYEPENGHSFECPAFVQKEEPSIQNTSENLENTSKPARDEKGRLLPGGTANPHGKPKGTKHYATLIKEALKNGRVKYKDPISGEETIITKEQALIYNLTDKAVNHGGSLDAIEVVLDRIEGKPKTSIAIGPDDEVDSIDIQIRTTRYNETADPRDEDPDLQS